jgi:hypothetical protein
VAVGSWQDFELADGRVLFQAKGYKNGNVHLRILPDAIKALNVEAGRLLGWLHAPEDVERELGYTAADEARALFGSNRQLTASNVRMLTAASDHRRSRPVLRRRRYVDRDGPCVSRPGRTARPARCQPLADRDRDAQ